MFLILSNLKNRYLSQRAQGMVEYALVLAFIVAIAVAVYGGTGEGGLQAAIQNVFTQVTNTLNAHGVQQTGGSGN